MRFALLPAKPRGLAKSRLAPALSDADRATLAVAMFEDALEALLAAKSLDRIVVVSADRGYLDRAAAAAVVTVDELEPRGLNGAASLGTRRCLELGATSVLIVLSDLPLMTGSDVEAVNAPAMERSGIRMVRSHEGLGTNALLRTPPLVIPTRFGGRSFQGHEAAARSVGIASEELVLPGIGFDVDTIEDLERIVRTGDDSRTVAAARRLGIDRTKAVGA